MFGHKTYPMPGKSLWGFVDLQPPMIVMHVVNQSWINYCDHLFRFGYFYSILTRSSSPPCCQLAVCVWFVLAGLNVTAVWEWCSLVPSLHSCYNCSVYKYVYETTEIPFSDMKSIGSTLAGYTSLLIGESG